MSFSRDVSLCGNESGDKEAAVTVAEEAEVVVKGVAVDVAPAFTAHKGRHEQKERGLRLVEIGNHAAHDMVVIPRGDDYLRGGVEGIEVVAIHLAEDGTERIH